MELVFILLETLVIFELFRRMERYRARVQELEEKYALPPTVKTPMKPTLGYAVVIGLGIVAVIALVDYIL